jgi:hypothetical protein
MALGEQFDDRAGLPMRARREHKGVVLEVHLKILPRRGRGTACNAVEGV